jgi:nucleoporin NUP159
LSIAGETKLQLLPSPWPRDALPKSTSTLFGVASKAELVAAAGPDTLVIASTTSVREAYESNAPIENNVKQFSPQLSIAIPRISHLAFSSDEAFLTICAAEGGGLQVYDVAALKQGNTNPALSIGTNGITVRALVPNPAPENGHIIAVVLDDGKLMLADLKTREFMAGKNGPILREEVSCVSWSVKGKQLVAGLGDGTLVQIDPAGDVKAVIPRPPQPIDGDPHVSGVSWLANDLFWIIYTPTYTDLPNVPDSTFMLVTRAPKTTNFQFQKMQDPCPPFGMNRSPQHHFNIRLREFPPNLTDVLVVASTASGDLGLITSSKVPLSMDAQHTAGIYTTTSMAVDSRRAQLPVSDDMTLDSTDTSPIGMAWDLGARTPVKRPIPAEEIDQTSTPLPALMVLNNDGVLSTWWFVYSESVRSGTAYPGLSAASSSQAPTASQSQQPSAFDAFGGQSQAPQSAFSKVGISSGAFGQAATPAFGKPAAATSIFGQSSTTTPAFGGQTTTPAFGSTSAFGSSAGSKLPVPAVMKPSPWGSSASATATGGGAAFGTPTQLGAAAKPSFGAPAALGGAAKPTFGGASTMGGAAFGASGGLGGTSSPWASAPGQTGTFGSATADKPAAPFGSMASAASPFASLTSGSEKPSAIFGGGSTSSQSPFATIGGNAGASNSAFGGAPASTTPFGASTQQPAPFGTSSATGAGSSIFSKPAPFGAPAPASSNIFGQPSKPTLATQESPEADMTDDTPTNTAPPSTQESQKPSIFGSGFKLDSAFKPDGSAKDDLPQSTGPSTSFFGNAFGNTLQNAVNPSPATPMKIKEEPRSPEILPSTTPQAAPPVVGGFVQSQVESKPLVPTTKSAVDVPVESATAEPPLPPSPKGEPAPLPVSPPQGPSEEQDFSPAGSPPIDLGASLTSLSPAESVGSDEVAAAKANDAPMPPDFLSKPSSLPKPTWSFAGITTPSKDKVPASSGVESSPAPSESNTPLSIAPTLPSPSATPASATRPPFQFQPSPALGASPRSPSPNRVNRIGPGPPGMLTPQPPRPNQGISTTPLGPPPSKSQPPPQHSLYNVPPTPRAPSHLASVQQAQSEPDEQHELIDDDDERIRQELSEPLDATKQLAPFIAHQDYAGKVEGQGVPHQIEKVYRDINSMIDTLGLNARSLASFLKGHNELFPDGVRDAADLEDDEDWCLTEIEDLGVLQKDMLRQLDAERPKDVQEKVSELQDVHRDLTKLRSRHHGLQKLVNSRQAKNTSARDEQLSTEQMASLADIRRDFAEFQQLLAQGEESVSMLKAKLAAVQQANGTAQAGGIPTVEAVVNTIAKMTRMIEQKSGDVDLLEAQMKRLKFKALPRGARQGTPSALDEALGRLSLGSPNGGRAESPFQTPPSTRSKLSASKGTYALTYSPDTSEDEGPAFKESFRSSMGSSAGAYSRSKGKMPKVSVEQVDAYMAKQEKKKKVMQLLREKLVAKGSA